MSIEENLSRLPRTLWWEVDKTDGVSGIYLIDQTRLPLQGDALCCRTVEGACLAIETLAVRGAPALGVMGAMTLALWAVNESRDETTDTFLAHLAEVAEQVSAARPTAVNLSWGVAHLFDFASARAQALAVASEGIGDEASRLGQLKEEMVAAAQQMAADDEAVNRSIGAHAAALLDERAYNVLTHCNAGSLATAYYGTALGGIYTAYEQGKINHVWVDETRPVNQGARLTAWELMVAGVPSTLIVDSAAAGVMANGWVDAVFVGADRIAANGDVANKVGTLMLAQLAHAYGIPFYVLAPSSSIDATTATGADIVIEQRDPRELEGVTVCGVIQPDAAGVARAFDLLTDKGACELKLDHESRLLVDRKGGGYRFDAWFRTTPPKVQVYNPAFDVTPAALISAVITEDGVYAPTEIEAYLNR
jgi:methylthioribose-1-phosphate isomerase